MDIQEVIQREIQEAMSSGLYSVASLDMFDIISKLELTDKLYSHLVYTNEILNEYLSEIIGLEDDELGMHEFLRALRVGDIIDNQKMEKENSFLMGLHSQISRETAMGKLIKYAKNGKELDSGDIFDLHHTLLIGTSSEGISSVRTVNNKFVGRFVAGERKIDYFPIDYRDVKTSVDKIAQLYNERFTGDNFDNVFIQAFLIHGLLGGLQIFSDGNTRMGRIMQHALMWQLINERTKFDFDMPPIYATRSYYPLRCKYRDLIASLVTDGSNIAWNNWIDFNLDRIEDSIYANTENLKILKKKLGRFY